VAGLALADMRTYLQDVQELSNFFERRVSAYQIGVTGNVSFDDDF
jgi:ribonucleoside-diphosphate reductase beta chain